MQGKLVDPDVSAGVCVDLYWAGPGSGLWEGGSGAHVDFYDVAGRVGVPGYARGK